MQWYLHTPTTGTSYKVLQLHSVTIFICLWNTLLWKLWWSQIKSSFASKARQKPPPLVVEFRFILLHNKIMSFFYCSLFYITYTIASEDMKKCGKELRKVKQLHVLVSHKKTGKNPSQVSHLNFSCMQQNVGGRADEMLARTIRSQTYWRKERV